MINLKKKLKNNQKTIGSWLTIANPIIAELMSKYFEWLVIDMEHSSITLNECQDLIRIIEANDCFPLVRVSENNSTIIKRVLDAGSYGIIIPMVKTKEDALNALNAAYYPPCGNRGVGLARAQNYGFGFDSYKQNYKKNIVVIPQIEHIEAVKNLDKILKTNIDAFIVGPYDISASLNTPGEFCSIIFQNALNKILDASDKYSKPAGIHVIPPYSENLLNLDKRYKFIAFSLDTLFLGAKIGEELNDYKKRI